MLGEWVEWVRIRPSLALSCFDSRQDLTVSGTGPENPPAFFFRYHLALIPSKIRWTWLLFCYSEKCTPNVKMLKQCSPTLPGIPVVVLLHVSSAVFFFLYVFKLGYWLVTWHQCLNFTHHTSNWTKRILFVTGTEWNGVGKKGDINCAENWTETKQDIQTTHTHTQNTKSLTSSRMYSFCSLEIKLRIVLLCLRVRTRTWNHVLRADRGNVSW